MIPEPTIRELLDAAGTAVRGLADKNADFIRGSDYESLTGPSAILWSRQARRDSDLFADVNFATASDQALTDMAMLRYGKQRILDSRGAGIVRLKRAAGGDAETIWKGTRFFVPGPTARFYRATADTPVAAGAANIVVPIEAVDIGPGVAVSVGGNIARIGDQLEDSTWLVVELVCADGQLFEKAEDFRERIRRELFEARVGQTAAIIKACKRVGAANVEVFRNNYAGSEYDHALNVVYVGDLGFSSPPDLVRACVLELQGFRALGDNLQVLPMARVELDIRATLHLYDHPALFDLERIERLHVASLHHYLNGSSGRFTYSLDGIRGAIARNTPEVQQVVLTTPTADDQIVVGAAKNFPATLNRYVPGSITLTYRGP